MRAFILLFLLSYQLVLLAQPGDPGGDPDIPFTGIEYLLLAGGALGIRKLWGKRNK
jgi:hypothetical protein